MTPRAFALAVGLACAGVQASAGAQSPPSDGAQILARAKAVFRAPLRPPYVSYTLRRRDLADGRPDLLNSYDLRVWCRTSDRKALQRHGLGGALGDAESRTVGFDGVGDPGPPTANIFERNLYTPRGDDDVAPDPYDTAPPIASIGGVRVQREYDYRVTSVRRDGRDWDLTLAPIRDPLRNRIDELWVDAASYAVTRARVRDHLYLTGENISLPNEYDLTFGEQRGLPVITAIHGATADGKYVTDYAFSSVAFPATMPAWYFDPATFPAHRADMPE